MTSGLHLTSVQHRAAVAKWSQNMDMCALSELVIFTAPYIEGMLGQCMQSSCFPYPRPCVDPELSFGCNVPRIHGELRPDRRRQGNTDAEFVISRTDLGGPRIL